MTDGSLRREIKRFTSGAVARLWRRPRLEPSGLLSLTPRRILVARPHNQMGDMVCATPVFRALRETWPAAEVALICAPVNHDVVRHNPHLDRVLLFDKRTCTRPEPLRDFLRTLRSFGPDLAFVPTSVSYSVTSAALAAASGARWLVGGDSAPYGFDISRHAYSLEMPSYPEMTQHAVDHHLAPFEAVGVTTDVRTTLVVPSAEEGRRATEIIANIPGNGPLWALHPGAAKTANLWPARRFAEIVRRAVAEGRRVLVLRGPADGEVVEELRRDLTERPALGDGVWSELPSATIGVVAAVLTRADRFLCNDTGVMHVAGAVSVPTLALFGPTDPALWAPRSTGLVALRGSDGRTDTLETDDVWRAWRALEGRDSREA